MATTSAKDGAIDLEAFLDRLARDGESIVIERDAPEGDYGPFAGRDRAQGYGRALRHGQPAL